MGYSHSRDAYFTHRFLQAVKLCLLADDLDLCELRTCAVIKCRYLLDRDRFRLGGVALNCDYVLIVIGGVLMYRRHKVGVCTWQTVLGDVKSEDLLLCSGTKSVGLFDNGECDDHHHRCVSCD